MDEKQLTILLADDDPGFSHAAALALREAGFAVALAANGEEALKQAEDLSPDLILLDERMPKKGGIEVLEEIRKKKWGKGLPVIFLTNIDNQDVINKALSLEAIDYLIKSDTPLESLVDNVRLRLS